VAEVVVSLLERRVSFSALRKETCERSWTLSDPLGISDLHLPRPLCMQHEPPDPLPASFVHGPTGRWHRGHYRTVL